MKTYGGVDIYIHIFLTSKLAGGEWSASCPGRFIARERALGPIGKKVGWTLGPDLRDVEKGKFLTLPGLQLRPLGRPAD
jgi:hypothetical protein